VTRLRDGSAASGSAYSGCAGDPRYDQFRGATPVSTISSFPEISLIVSGSAPAARARIASRTALAAIIAAATSRKLSLLFLTAFGFYYALDAVFFLTYGLFNEKPWLDDVLLNLPHVLIAAAMLGIVYRLAPARE
jgi:hypothetical protein